MTDQDLFLDDPMVPKSNRKQYDVIEGALLVIALLMVIGAGFFAGYTTIQRLAIIDRDIDNDAVAIPIERVPGEADTAVATDEVVDAAAILERAEDSVNSVDLLLSFLEGASVLIAVALGAAAFYGIRQSNQLRTELIDEYNLLRDQIRREQLAERKKVEERLEELQHQREEMERFRDLVINYEPQFRTLDSMIELRTELHNKSNDLRQTIDNVSKLLQADQEFRVRNHREAHRFITDVLQHDPDNPLALYMAGWVETHYIGGEEDRGLVRLQQLLELDPHWPSANAAYGVALRRKAMRATPIDRDMLEEAQGYIRIALGRNRRLVDYNQESFWGPLGGLLRDMGDIDGAIEAYRSALRVTPGSSYPQGNLATLLLQKAQQDNNREQEALEAFRHTIELANGELASRPNDYFLLMDLAQAYSVLGRVNRVNFGYAEENLQRALNLVDSVDLLTVSKRGWYNLEEFAPRRMEWNEFRQAGVAAIEAIDERIRELVARQPSR